MRSINANELRSSMKKVLQKHRLSDTHANEVIDTLISASLDGIDTHGIRLLPTYLRELSTGSSNPLPKFTLSGPSPAVGILDADQALGSVAGNEAMRIAIERAKLYGISAISVKNSNHFGAAGYYAKLAAAHGMIGIVFSNSDALVSPFNGTTALNGTNPLAISAPALNGNSFCLDMATSQISFSRIKHYLEHNIPIPLGWAQDANGHDSSISQSVKNLSPLGGYKGQGLGMMVQILTSVLSGTPFDKDLSHLHTPNNGRPREISHFFISINIQSFCDLEVFKGRLTQLLEIFRNSSSLENELVLVPGDKEAESRRIRLLDGIPLSDTELSILNFK